MDDSQFGSRNKRGDWAPRAPLTLAPFWRRSTLTAANLAAWIRGYLWPWNLLIAAGTALWWWLFVPDAATAQTLAWPWVLKLLAANLIGIGLFFGAFEWRWYRRRVQERRFKYNGKFPAEQPSDVFWWRSQNLDNAVRSLFVTVPIGTTIEVALLWAFANGVLPTVDPQQHPLYLALLLLAAPVIHEVHFYWIHRSMHWPPFYKLVHSVHHNSVNPSPWSSLSMHPVEGALYFGVMLWAAAIPSHPLLAVYFFHIAGFGAVVGHIGFDKLEFGGSRAQDSHAYAHYLHHKHFDVNYSDNGVVPLDEWFGTWHDGSPEGARRMQARFEARQQRLNKA